MLWTRPDPWPDIWLSFLYHSSLHWFQQCYSECLYFSFLVFFGIFYTLCYKCGDHLLPNGTIQSFLDGCFCHLCMTTHHSVAFFLPLWPTVSFKVSLATDRTYSFQDVRSGMCVRSLTTDGVTHDIRVENCGVQYRVFSLKTACTHHYQNIWFFKHFRLKSVYVRLVHLIRQFA